MSRVAVHQSVMLTALVPAVRHQLNPYINYPFLTVEPLKRFIETAHAAGARVKLYYTVRELSASASELWALRALKGEIIVPSPAAGGSPWLREHLRENYSAAWHEVSCTGGALGRLDTPAPLTLNNCSGVGGGASMSAFRHPDPWAPVGVVGWRDRRICPHLRLHQPTRQLLDRGHSVLGHALQTRRDLLGWCSV